MIDVDLTPELEDKLDGEHDKDLARKIALGFDVENFLRSNIGRVLVARALEEKRGLLKELIEADLLSEAGITAARRVQQRIAVISYWPQGLADIQTEGVAAGQQLTERMHS